MNLERPLRADGRLGGHFVMGHVDATGTVEEIRSEAEFYWVTIGFPSLLAPYMIHKGSVAVDGISLTVVDIRQSSFTVAIIPHTEEMTTLGRKARICRSSPRERVADSNASFSRVRGLRRFDPND